MRWFRRFPSSVGLLLLLGCQRDALAPKPNSWATGPRFSKPSPPPPDPAAPPGHIAFVRVLPPLNRDVFRMDATGASVTRLADGYAPAWSPVGSRIAFNCGINICVMNADGSGIVQLAATAEAAAWSPDGSRIAFHAQDQTGNWDIYAMDANGVNQVRLTTDPAVDGNPDWSPDGTRIAFERIVNGTDQVLVMNADGTGAVQQLTSGPGGEDPAWSPNGTKIAFASNRSGQSQIYMMNSDGTGLVQLVTTTGGSGPDWSLDGSRIVFACPVGKTTDICAINPDGSRAVDLTSTRYPEHSPSWGP